MLFPLFNGLGTQYIIVISDWDVGAYYFYGTGRKPRLIPDPANQRLIP